MVSNVYNSKKSTKSSIKLSNSKKKLHTAKYFAKCSSQIYLKAIFILPKAFYTKKNLNTAGTPTEVKQNLLH